MPNVHRIQVPGEISDLIALYGLVGPVNEWFLSDTVIPVTLVATETTITAETAPIVFTDVDSAGEQTAPLINVVLADTGALDVGDYYFKFVEGHELALAAVRQITFGVRNAANSAYIWSQSYFVGNSVALYQTELAWSMAQNERFRCETLQAFGAGEQIHVNIFHRKLTS